MTVRLTAAALAALLASGCTDGGPYNPDAGFPAFDVTIGGVRLVATSSAAIANGNVFTILLSDQPNACQQYGHFPARTWTTLTLVMAASTSSPTVGTIVPQQGVPGPGQVVGGLVQATADLPPSANLNATDGTVTWKSNVDFSVTLQSMDVGFEGTTDRLSIQTPIGVPACTPQL
jgi:hypothetical protein